MTKGFLALLLPALIALPYMVWQKRFRELLGYGPLAVLVAMLVCLPWALAVQQREPDFWSFFFWHEHIQRFAADDAQHLQPWWFYVPVLVMASLPWAAMLPTTFTQAWKSKSQPSTVFVLLWLLLPLAFLSLSRGKLPTYVMPCMLPLALLMGPALVDRLERASFRALRLNGLLNIALGVIVLAALAYMQHSSPIYDNEPLHLSLAVIAVAGWICANILQVLRPLTLWVMPALGAWLFIALIPMSLPNSTVFNKTPDGFIARHAAALSQSKRLLSNDLGAASALSWRIRRPDIALYNTMGEVKYGLTYPDAAEREVDLAGVQQWMTVARSEGQVGVVMRINGQDDQDELELLPKDGQRYEEGNIVILIFAQSAS
jgi:4-amino-4-deoxy-L-arabinose transferase